MICALVLAAGESKRMGRPKQLLSFGRQTLIETVVENATKAQVDETRVVLGAHKGKIKAKLEKYAVTTIDNPRYKEGMLSSIQEGFLTAPENARALVVILGDQPTVPSSVIDKLVYAYKKSGKGIVLPVFQKKRGHPILIDTKYRREVAALDPGIGLRALVHGHPEDIEEIAVSTPAILKDIDNPADYLEATEKPGFKSG